MTYRSFNDWLDDILNQGPSITCEHLQDDPADIIEERERELIDETEQNIVGHRITAHITIVITTTRS